jgi:hypothetical protein
MPKQPNGTPGDGLGSDLADPRRAGAAPYPRASALVVLAERWLRLERWHPKLGEQVDCRGEVGLGFIHYIGPVGVPAGLGGPGTE